MLAAFNVIYSIIGLVIVANGFPFVLLLIKLAFVVFVVAFPHLAAACWRKLQRRRKEQCVESRTQTLEVELSDTGDYKKKLVGHFLGPAKLKVGL